MIDKFILKKIDCPYLPEGFTAYEAPLGLGYVVRDGRPGKDYLMFFPDMITIRPRVGEEKWWEDTL